MLKRRIASAFAKIKQEKLEIIDHTRLGVDVIYEMYQSNRAAIIFEEREVVAMGLLYATNDSGWLEAGTFWSDSSRRGRGHGRQMFDQLCELMPKNKNIFAITHTAQVIHLLEKAGWQEVSWRAWEETVPLIVTCGPCVRFLTNKEKRRCEFKATRTNCALFVRG